MEWGFFLYSQNYFSLEVQNDIEYCLCFLSYHFAKFIFFKRDSRKPMISTYTAIPSLSGISS